jgi:hypothetical protein
MNTKLLIDAIVQQTTVLIAQLSTAAGIRAPLAHIADQVFVELSREIEAQGVSRKVAADMFGLAIRTYQKKVHRLTDSVGESNRTLWQQTLEHLERVGSATRRELFGQLRPDDPIVAASVLSDLVSSGLIYKTGSGDSAVFGITKERDLARTVREQRRESLAWVAWLVIYRSGAAGASLAWLAEQLQTDPESLAEDLSSLVREGQLEVVDDPDGPHYRAQTFLVAVGAEHGWEAAVFDHFAAVVRAIGAKVRQGQTRSAADNVVGGATLGFDISPGHPYETRVLSLLRRTRDEVNELWNEVQSYNDAHPIPEDSKTEVTFYFGQCVARPNDE